MKVPKIICFTHTKIATPAIFFMTLAKILWTHATHRIYAKV